MLKKTKLRLKVSLNQESGLFLFICIVTCLVSGAVKLGFISAAVFIAFLYLYFAVLRFIWRLGLKVFKSFILATVENGKGAE